MAGGNLLRKAAPALGQPGGLWGYQHPEEGLRRERENPNDEQGHAAMTGSRARRNGVAPYMASMQFVLSMTCRKRRKRRD